MPTLLQCNHNNIPTIISTFNSLNLEHIVKILQKHLNLPCEEDKFEMIMAFQKLKCLLLWVLSVFCKGRPNSGGQNSWGEVPSDYT
jgi:hypothetical protein